MDTSAPLRPPFRLAAGAPASPVAAAGARGGRFFGYPDAALAGTWTVKDLCGFLRVSERKARQLMKAPGAPSPLRTASDRCDRWNPYQVVAWLHGDPGAALPDAAARVAAPGAPAAGVGAEAAAAPSGRAAPPGRPWAPAAAR